MLSLRCGEVRLNIGSKYMAFKLVLTLQSYYWVY